MFLNAVVALCCLFELCRSDYNFATMDTSALLRHWGYEAEKHEVITDDGYILSLFRIPNSNSKYYPIIAQHGLFVTSDCWILCDPKQDLVLLLADEGFDVWLLNNRGNTYSKRHVSYNNNEKKFWDFGWHEIGIYDIPATIDYVIQHTGQNQVIHIGNSLGTTSFYVMLSTKPEMNKKIKSHVSLAPIVYLSQSKLFTIYSPIFVLVNRYVNELVDLLDALNIRDTSMFSFIMQFFCEKEIFFELCRLNLLLGVGPDFNQFNKDCSKRFLGHVGSGGSVKIFQHYLQQGIGGEFREFDYGSSMNMNIYGTSKPRLYNLSQVTAPINLYYASNDFISSVKDVEKLASALPNVKKKYKIPYRSFNHIDYFLANDVKTLLHDELINTMKMHLIE